MEDDEDAVAAACAIVAILADSHNRKGRADQQNRPITALRLRRIPA